MSVSDDLDGPCSDAVLKAIVVLQEEVPGSWVHVSDMLSPLLPYLTSHLHQYLIPNFLTSGDVGSTASDATGPTRLLLSRFSASATLEPSPVLL